MYIEPNTEIRILKNVPLDDTYDHTIYFDSANAQEVYFKGLTKYPLTNQTYQRVNRGTIRVGVKSDDLYDCNYIMFQNKSFGTKWFYAFLKSAEYVNNNLSEITFEIDVMQTWMFDYKLDQCFVEREHSATDFRWEHNEEENLDIGDECIAITEWNVDMNDMSVAVLYVDMPDSGQPPVPNPVINGVYTALNVATYKLSDMQQWATLSTFINSFVQAGYEDNIVAIFQYPSWLGDAHNGNNLKTYNLTYDPKTTTVAGGYAPRNKKLYSYPFNYMLAYNNNGDTAIYRWEDWPRGRAHVAYIDISGVFMSTPCIMAYPRNYRGLDADYMSGLTLSNFPQCAWVGDTFKAWWAQNRASVVTGTISSVLSSTAGAAAGLVAPLATGNPVAMAVSGVSGAINVFSSVSSVMAKITDMKAAPNQVHGQTQTDSLSAAMGRCKFTFYQMVIKEEYARKIDDYFDRFGYSCKLNKVPNRNVRPHWTYTKTIGCTISGSIPVDDMRKICNIYNSGITFWKNGNEVGNYSLDNRVNINNEP